MAKTVPPSALTINIGKDLSDLSHLRALLHANSSPLLMIGSQIQRFAGRPISAAVGSPAIDVTVAAPGHWTTSSRIGFALASSARCTLSISQTSTNFSVTTDLDSKQTEGFVTGPLPGRVYINLQLDFSLRGSISGRGNPGMLGVSGKAAGAVVTSLSYCHPTDAGLETSAAIREAFDYLVFPFEPSCARRMPVGSVGRVSFDGSLGFSLTASCGLGSFAFAAPSVDTARQSLLVFKPPSVSVDSGATATVDYDHEDHFTAIVSRTTSTEALLTLTRSSEAEVAGTLGIKVGVSISKADVHIDDQQLGTAVNTALGGGGDQAVALTDHLQSKLTSKTGQWLSDVSGSLSFLATLSRQNNRVMLYRYRADLTRTTLEQSWTEFVQGDLRKAGQNDGLQLLPGSAVADSYRRSVGLNLEIFNFFHVSDKKLFFRNSRAEVAPDGTLRFLYDVGRERDTETQKAMRLTRMHFVAKAQQTSEAALQNAEVEFIIEMNESGHKEDGQTMADTIGSLGPNSNVQKAQVLMQQFASGKASGTLSLLVRLKPSAFQKLACSEFSGTLRKTPPPLPQTQDSINWAAFRLASETLLHLAYVRTLSYDDWRRFNEMCNDGRLTSGYVPNRRRIGDLGAITPGFYGPDLQEDSSFITFFLRASAQFMNLCDDLHSLGGANQDIDTSSTWDNLLENLTRMVINDTNLDWSRPAVRALLQLCAGADVEVTTMADAAGIACVVNVS